jgi:hypothetical protein
VKEIEKQTENYIILKPLAERFNRIASEITDDEIRSLIKTELKDQMKCVDFGGMVAEIACEWVDNNAATIMNLLLESYRNKLQ